MLKVNNNNTIRYVVFVYFENISLREKYPNTELFLVRIFLYSVRIQENTDQKKLRIWTLFTQFLAQHSSL